MKRMTIKGFKLGWDSSKLLPSYVGLYERLDKIENILGDDYDLDRLNELVKADKEERCVMLPIKIGGFVYIPLFGRILKFELAEVKMLNYIPILTFSHGKIIMFFTGADIGENIFLTKEEAEQTLKERKRHD